MCWVYCKFLSEKYRLCEIDILKFLIQEDIVGAQSISPAQEKSCRFLLYEKLRKANGHGRERNDDWHRVTDVGAGTARFCFMGNCAKQTTTDAKEMMIGIVLRMWGRVLPAFAL